MKEINPTKQRIAAWSYSRYSKWSACPRSAYYAYIEKVKEAPSAAMERGSAIHKEIENWVNASEAPAPKCIHPTLVPDYLQMKEEEYIAESEITFTSSWKLTGWFDASAWLRVKTDLISPSCNVVIDTKTGRMRDGYTEQLSLYAMAADKISEVKHSKITTALLFVDSGDKVVEVFDRKELDALPVRWEKKVKPMLADTTFTPNPGNACRWCPFSKSKSGLCDY